MIAAIAALWWGLASAEPLTLTEAWEQASASPGRELARATADAGRAERLEARAYDNLSVGLTSMSRVLGTEDAFNGNELQLDLGVPLPVTGARGARLKRGRLGETLGLARAQALETSLAEEVGMAWLDLLAAQEREAVLAGALARVEDLVALTARRAEAGAARRWDVDRMQLARVTFARQLARAAQERRLAASALAGALGTPERAMQAAGDLDAPLPVAADPAESPAVTEARAAVAHRAQGVREQRRGRIADPELQLGGYWTRANPSTSVIAGLSWELPTFDLGRGRVAAASAEHAAAKATQRGVESAVQAERAALVEALDGLTVALSQDLVPTEDLLSAAEVAWREGETGILELVDAMSADVDARLEGVDLRWVTRLAELRLAALEGRLGAALRP